MDEQTFPNRSTAIAALAAALAKAQGQMEGAAKDSTNPHFKSKYADLASVWDACRKPLSANGLSVLQPVSADGAAVTVTTILTHSSGEWIAESLTLVAQQNTPQGVGSAITYGRRYGLSAMVGIAPEDDDGNAASQSFGTTQRHVDRPEPNAPAPLTAGDFGPVQIVTVAPGVAGAAAELTLNTGHRVLVYKQPLKAKAEKAAKDREAVVLSLKKSTSGNCYVDGIVNTGLTPDALEATKYTHDTPTIQIDKEAIPF